MRKANLARLLARRPSGHLHFRIRTGEIGPDLFRKTCEFDLAGLCQSAGTASTAPADRQVDQGQEPRHYGANATSYFAGLANIDPTVSRTPVQSAPTSWALARAPRPRFNGSMRRLSLAIVLCLLAGQAFAACGDKGGPGYRSASGRCVGWADIGHTCGNPPSTKCTAENTANGAEAAADLGQKAWDAGKDARKAAGRSD